MKIYFIVSIVLLLAGCSDNEVRRTIAGPEGIIAELIEVRHDASAPNNIRINLVSKDGANHTTIFNGTDGSRANVIFKDHTILIQYCYPTEYNVVGYIYSVGNNYAYSDIRITAATVESVIDGIQFCQGGIGK